MAFPIGEFYKYSAPSTRQSTTVATGTQPVILITSNPAELTNSLQAHFVVDVLLGGVSSSVANLYYNLDNAPSHTARGVARTADFSFADSGAHHIVFIAEQNGVYSEPVIFNWTIDVTRPSVINAIPLNNSCDIGVIPAIEITFSEPMQTATVTGGTTISPSIMGTWRVENSGTKFVFTPTGSLGYGQKYTITVDETAKDLAGNEIISQYQYSFTTIIAVNKQPNPPTFIGITNATFTSSNIPRLAFNVPSDPDSDSLHFWVELATNATFSSGFLQFSSDSSPANFTYYDGNGNKIYPFPSSGVASGIGKVVFLGQNPLADGRYWVRAIADDRRS